MKNNENYNRADLPKGWIWTRIEEICLNITKGSTPTSYGYSFKNEGIKFIKTENINENGDIEEVNDFIDLDTNEFLKRSILKLKDILFSIAGTIGRIGLIKEKDLPANTNQALAIIRGFWNYIDNKYVFYFLKSPFIQKLALNSIVGVGRANVSLTNLSNFMFPLPPLSEQHRIVTKIEELFTRMDTGLEALKKIKAQLKRYRQAVLRYAFEGKLTEEWREKHKGEIEPADVLVERIRQERSLQGAERRGKLKKSKDEIASLSARNDHLTELPEGWVWMRIKDISDNIHYGYTASASEEKVGPKLLRITDIQNNSVNWKAVPYCKIDESEKQQYLLKDGDLVFARTGATVGKSFLIVGNISESVFASYLIRIILNSNVNKKFIYSFFQSSNYWGQISKGKLGIGQPNVNAQTLSQITIPLPPFPEQNKIVEEIERRFSVADEIERTVDQSLKQAERLRQSILKKAFEGNLVPQDPNDEPAEKLLERIKAEKAKLSDEYKIKSKRRKSYEQKTSGMV